MTRLRPGRLRAAAIGIAGALLFGACAPPLPQAEPDPTPSELPPVLSESQESAVLTAVGEAISAADKARDPKLLRGRVMGPALAMRTSQLNAAARLKNDKLIAQLPVDVDQQVVPTTQAWPRTSYAVSVRPDDVGLPRLMALEQAGARDEYKLWAWARLFPGITMPNFADSTIGSPAVAGDDDSLLVTPVDAVAQYADVLNVGKSSAFVATFPGTDPYRDLLASLNAAQNSRLATAAGKQTMTFTSSPEQVRAVRTSDGGALVMGALTAIRTQTAEAGAKIMPEAPTEVALFGATTPANSLKTTFQVVVALYIPPADAKGPVQVLGNEQVATAVAVK